MIATSHITVTRNQFKELMKLPVTGAFQILNLLKFKDQVGDGSLSGIQACTEYMQAVMPFFEKSKAKVIFQGKPLLGRTAPEQKE